MPVMSMLRWLADTEAQTDVLALLSFRSFNDIIYRDELNWLAARHSNIKIVIALTKDCSDAQNRQIVPGRINQAKIAGCVPDIAERAVYLCGPLLS